MKKVIPFFVVAVLVLTCAGQAGAQLSEGKPLFTASIAGANGELSLSGAQKTGWGLAAGFEQMSWGWGIAGALNFAYVSFNDSYADTTVNYYSFPMSLGAKYYFLKDKTFHPYLGAAIGVHLTWLTENYGDISKTNSDSGLMFAVPLGLLFEVGDNVGINVGYTAHYTDSSFFGNNLVHVFTLGLTWF